MGRAARPMSQPYQMPGSDLHEALWQNQSGQCALCGKAMLTNRFDAPHARLWSKWRATLDHIQPRAKGGSDRLENLQLTHAQCNKVKGCKV